MLPLIIIGVLLLMCSYFVGSDYGHQVLGGEHETLRYWTNLLGWICIGIAVALLILAIIFLGGMAALGFWMAKH